MLLVQRYSSQTPFDSLNCKLIQEILLRRCAINPIYSKFKHFTCNAVAKLQLLLFGNNLWNPLGCCFLNLINFTIESTFAFSQGVFIQLTTQHLNFIQHGLWWVLRDFFEPNRLVWNARENCFSKWVTAQQITQDFYQKCRLERSFLPGPYGSWIPRWAPHLADSRRRVGSIMELECGGLWPRIRGRSSLKLEGSAQPAFREAWSQHFNEIASKIMKIMTGNHCGNKGQVLISAHNVINMTIFTQLWFLHGLQTLIGSLCFPYKGNG